MGMPQTARRYTVDEVLAFPSDGNRYELVDGELLVSPAPANRHQTIIMRLVLRLGPYLAARGRPDNVKTAPADISWTKDVLVQPDIFVTTAEESLLPWAKVKHLVLAIEVLSPSSHRADRVTKRRTYQRFGVETYWIVDPDARVVEVWRPGDEAPELITGTLTWRPTAETPAVEIDLPALFANLPQ